jgi:hypothetical protein
MRTIFLTIFEGTEAKNILRTKIFPTIMSQSDIRLVILVKNKERAEYHRREFNDSRIIYEVVSPPEPQGLDLFFSRLKFTLLRTFTTDFRRRMNFRRYPKYFSYYWGLLLNRVLARPFFLRAARWLDFTLVRNRTYTHLFEHYKPDLVFLANLFEDAEINLLREAKRHSVKTVAMINSWDKTTARCVLRLLPDKLIVWNDSVKDAIIKYDLAKPEDILVSGIPQYDDYFKGSPSIGSGTNREDFFRSIKSAGDRKILVYSPVGATISGDADWEVIDMLHRLNDEGRFSEKVSILVRFPPNDFVDAAELAKRPYLLYDYPGVRFSKKRGIDWDMSFTELRHLENTLHYMSIMICYASSISVDAAVFDKPVINLFFDIKSPKSHYLSATEYYEFEHYKDAIKTGGIRLVKNETELAEWINKYLKNPALDREGRRRLVGEQCKFTDGGAGSRIGKYVLGLLK